MRRLLALLALMAAPALAQSDPIGEAARASGFQGVYALSSGETRVAGGSVGVADTASGAPFRYEMVFPLGPVAGQVIAAMVMQQADAGRIRLDAPAARYRVGLGGTTVRQLLRQRRYADLLGVLARATGRPVPQLYVEQIVSANGMGALFAGPSDVRADASWAGGPDTAERMGSGSPGAMVGTAEDVLAFDQALIDGRLLPDAARRTLANDPAFGQGYTLSLPGCAAPVRVVEQRGTDGRFEASNIILPDKGVSLVMLTSRGGLIGDLRQARGPGFAMLSALAAQGCR